MKLQTHLEIMAGGPGSGCNPSAGKCGRHGGGGRKKPPSTPKRLIKQQTTAPGAAPRATYTFLKPVTAGRPKGAVGTKGGPKKFEGHYMKGKFTEFLKDATPHGTEKSRVSVFDAERTKDWNDKAKEGEGATVIVHRDLGKKTIEVRQYNRGEYGWVRAGETKITKFRNMGRGAKFLKEKFGITQKLPKGKRK